MTTKQSFRYKDAITNLKKKKKLSGQTHREKAVSLKLTLGFWKEKWGRGEGKKRGLCLLNSEVPSSLTSVAENCDSSFHLVSIRQGNLANGWPRNCSTCTSWPQAPVKEPKRMKKFPSVPLYSLGQEKLLSRETECSSTLLGRFTKDF